MGKAAQDPGDKALGSLKDAVRELRLLQYEMRLAKMEHKCASPDLVDARIRTALYELMIMNRSLNRLIRMTRMRSESDE